MNWLMTTPIENNQPAGPRLKIPGAHWTRRQIGNRYIHPDRIHQFCYCMVGELRSICHTIPRVHVAVGAKEGVGGVGGDRIAMYFLRAPAAKMAYGRTKPCVLGSTIYSIHLVQVTEFNARAEFSITQNTKRSLMKCRNGKGCGRALICLGWSGEQAKTCCTFIWCIFGRLIGVFDAFDLFDVLDVQEFDRAPRLAYCCCCIGGKYRDNGHAGSGRKYGVYSGRGRWQEVWPAKEICHRLPWELYSRDTTECRRDEPARPARLALLR